jgi:multidrug efflux system outer membrane protein
MRSIPLTLALGAAVLLGGCVVGPKYKSPTVNAPPAFRGQEGAAQSASIADLPWWEVFQDQTLQGLVRTAIANNYDLRIAVRRVEQARELSVQARSEYYPGAGYEVGVSGGKNEELGTPTPNSGKTTAAAILGLGATWELDLWGRIRHMNESALAAYLASDYARRGVILSLTTGVAQAYYELLELDLRLDIARRTVEAFRGSLGIFQQRLEGGTASRLETARAEAALASTAAEIPEIERQIALKENELRILLGSNPGPIERHALLLDQTVPPGVPAGLPSALLERRPDVLQAEQAVRSANAQIGIAQAAFFPTIGLTALLGRMSSPLDDMLAGRMNVWSLAANMTGPLYAGGSLRSKKRQAIAAWEQARLEFQQTAMNAFRDVSNALITRQRLEAIRVEQQRAVEAYKEAVTVSTQRYQAGKSSYFEVLEAEQQLYPAENALALTELNRRIVIVQLYQALGGGWNLKNAEWSGPPSATPAAPSK